MNTIHPARQHVNRSQAMPDASANAPRQLGTQKPPADQRQDMSSSTADRKSDGRRRIDMPASHPTTNQALPPASSARLPPREPLRAANKVAQQSRARARSTSATNPPATSTSATNSAETKQNALLSNNKGRNAMTADTSKMSRAAHGQRHQNIAAAPVKALAQTGSTAQSHESHHSQPNSNSNAKSTVANSDSKSGPGGKPELQPTKRGAASLAAPAQARSRPVTPVDYASTQDPSEAQGSKVSADKAHTEDHHNHADSAKRPRRTKTPQPAKETATKSDPQASAKGTAVIPQQPASRPTSPSSIQHAKPSEPPKEKEYVPKERVLSELSRVRPYWPGFFEGAFLSSKFTCLICHPHGGSGTHYTDAERVAHYKSVHALFCKKCPNGGSVDGFSSTGLAAHLSAAHSEHVQATDLASIATDAMKEQNRKQIEAAKERREKLKEAQQERANAAKARHEGQPGTNEPDQQEHAGDTAAAAHAAPQAQGAAQKAQMAPLHGQVMQGSA